MERKLTDPSTDNNNQFLSQWIDPDVDLSAQKYSIIKPNLDNYIADILCNELGTTKYYRWFEEGIDKINKENEDDPKDITYAKSAALDCFKVWFNDKRIISVNPKMYWFHYFLTNLDNHLLRMITQDKFGFSYIAAKVVIDIIGKVFYDNNYNNIEEQIDKLNQLIINGEDPSTNDLGKSLDSAATRAMNKIKKNIKKADELGIGKGSHPADLKMVDSLLDSGILNQVNITKKQINEFVKHIIDCATESIGGQVKVREESIFEADDIDDINNVENFLHEVLYPELSVNERKYYISFDVYIDDSGSMSGYAYFKNSKGKETRTTLRALARIFVYKLLKLNILRNVYLFSSTDQLLKLNESEIFNKTFNGGTDIKQCINKSKEKRRPSIIVTDGYDHFDKENDYYDKVYFVVLDCHELPDCFEKYYKNNQILFWINGIFEKPELITKDYGGNREYTYIVPKSHRT